MPLCQGSRADVYYIERGAGEPVVFLNGLAGDCLAWTGLFKRLARSYRCLAIENRDVGQSQYVSEPYTIAEMAHDALGVCDLLQLDSFHLVGVSMGGMIAQELALAAPQRVRSIVFAQTMARCDDWFRGTLAIFELVRRQVPDTASFFEKLLPWWVSPSFFRESGRTTWLSWLLRQNPYDQSLDGFLRQLRAISQHDCHSRLEQITCPALVITGEDDQIMPRHLSQELRGDLPRASHVALDSVGHAILIEDPGRFQTAIASFLACQGRPTRQSA